MAGKYMQIGQVLEGSKGKYIQIDNVNLKKLVKLLTEHGETHLKGLSEDDIMKGQKLKYSDPNHVPRLKVYMFDPNDNTPDFILNNLAVKVVTE